MWKNTLMLLYLMFKFAEGAELECTILSEKEGGYMDICDSYCRVVHRSTVNLTCDSIGASFTIGEGTRIDSVILDSNISKLPFDAFKNLPSFSNLHLQNLGLTDIFPGAFNSHPNLTAIYLDGNNLRNISGGIFNSLMELRILNLDRNHIDHITSRAFVGTQLESLYLSNNNISNLSTVLFSSLGFLKTLDISYNKLNRIIDLFEHLSIVHLNISNNKISSLTDMLSGNLETLIAGNNSISYLENDTLKHLFKLRQLDLNNNNLSSILPSCFKDLFNLNYLNLSTNHLSSFIFGTFDGLSNLRILDISNNQFKTLPYPLHSLYRLENFYFQYNDISEINVAEFLREKPNLTYVQFNNNKWNCNKLMNIVNYFKQHAVSIVRGNCSERSNVHGIECQVDDNRLDQDQNVSNISLYADIDTSKLRILFNENFTDTVMYRFFNKEFRNSSFARYLESLNNTNNEYLAGNRETLTDKLIKNQESTDKYQETSLSILRKLQDSFARYLQSLNNTNYKNLTGNREILTDKLIKNQESIDKLTGILGKNQETSLSILRKLEDSLDRKITNQQSFEKKEVNSLGKLTERLSDNQEIFLSHLNNNLISNSKRRDGFSEEAFSAKYTSDNSGKTSDAVFVFILILLVVNILVLALIGYASIFRKNNIDNVMKRDVELSQLLNART